MNIMHIKLKTIRNDTIVNTMVLAMLSNIGFLTGAFWPLNLAQNTSGNLYGCFLKRSLSRGGSVGLTLSRCLRKPGK